MLAFRALLCDATNVITFMRSIVLIGAMAGTAAFANTPPIPPPDPDRLAAARHLVSELPLEDAVGDGFNGSGVTAEVADNAMAWLATQPRQFQGTTLKQVFYEKVRLESRAQLTAAIGDARSALAESYARPLSERDLRGTRDFAMTPEGKAFFRVQLSGDKGMLNLVGRFLYERMFPKLPKILESARQSDQVLNRINRKR